MRKIVNPVHGSFFLDFEERCFEISDVFMTFVTSDTKNLILILIPIYYGRKERTDLSYLSFR